MDSFNPSLDLPTGVIALVLMAVGVAISCGGYHLRLARQAQIVGSFLEIMANPAAVCYDEFWQFLRDFGFWDGKQLQLKGKIGHGIASPKMVAKVLARVLVENPSLRYEVVRALCLFYFKPRARFSCQASLPEMIEYILNNIDQGDERGLRIWHDFSRLAKLKALELEKIKQPKLDVENIDPAYAKAYRLAKQVILAPKRIWGSRSLPAPANSSSRDST